MKGFSKLVVAVVAMVGLFLGGGISFGASVVAVALDTATQAAWRTPSAAKPLDGDQNNVSGTAGYYAFATGGIDGNGVNAFNGGDINGLPSWVALAANGANNSFAGAYEMIDNPLTTPGASPTTTHSGFSYRTGVGANTNVTLFNLNFSAGAPGGTIRVGLLENSGDIGAGTLELSGVTSATINIPDDTGVSPAPVLRWAFFDVSGAAGTTVTISGTIATPGNLGLSAITFDTVPEPASMSLLVAGGVVLLRRRRA